MPEHWLVGTLGFVGLAIVALVGVTVFFGIRLLRLWTKVRDPEMPVWGKATFWGALAYTVSPVDLIPDPVYLDDIGVLIGAIICINKLARKYGITERLKLEKSSRRRQISAS